MSDIIRRYKSAGPTLPNSSWVRSAMPNKVVGDFSVTIDGVPEIKADERDGQTRARGLFNTAPPPPVKEYEGEPRKRSIFRSDNPRYANERNDT